MNRRETVPLPRRVPKPRPDPRQPEVVALLQKAKEWKRTLEEGEAPSRAALGRRVGASGQRVGHMVWLAANLMPELEAAVVTLPAGTSERVVTIKQLVRAVRAGHVGQRTLVSRIRCRLVDDGSVGSIRTTASTGLGALDQITPPLID